MPGTEKEIEKTGGISSGDAGKKGRDTMPRIRTCQELSLKNMPF